MFEWLLQPEAWVTLITLTTLEIVLGIDNIIFIAILVNKLPAHQRDRARFFGLSLAMLTRIGLLASLFWIMKLIKPLFYIGEMGISGRDLILIIGGIFLLYKSTKEIYEQTEVHQQKEENKSKGGLIAILIQIAFLDIVFSLDSVITAVGMAQQLEIMILAIIIAIGVMMFASRGIAQFVDTHPTIKTLALAFLLMVGIVLILEGFKIHIPKAYIYFAMGFSFAVELLNIYIRKKSKQS
ncbi:TerC family protein [Helicobacter cholecystus]|uniref:TerC family protein n=1 Tax=Helicobacter cholecystus TaxID=45498 RepID=UPI00273930E9|nr:TerC family protein [Helicobacter cholecystus]